ncbi:hypothetical protein PV783_13935 [Chitinophaga sp. CC14]|uniref:MauE/DoxX family redox-associated membrane protein n=1 Tax=Chitinophaga sp. CC14 TaxID=3029199 RepID=UPI003B81C61B
MGSSRKTTLLSLRSSFLTIVADKGNLKYVVFFLSVIFQLLFIYAAVTKISDFQKFTVELGQSPLLTYFVLPVAILTPLAELFISVLLYFPASRKLGLYFSFSLMTLFTSYIIAITRFASYVPCACGGILGEMGWRQHLIFNISFTALALTGIVLAEWDQYRSERTSVQGLVIPG